MSDIRILIATTAAVGIAIGVAVGSQLQTDDDGSAAARAAQRHPTASLPSEFNVALSAIRDELAVEHDARVALAEKIKREIKLLHAASAGPATASSPQSASPPFNAKFTQPSSPSIDLESELAETWFSDTALLELGFPAEEIARLRARFEEMELEKHYLRDYAIRENWITSSRYTDALREIGQDLHASLGDDDYDKVLFAIGRGNRVRVSDALQGAPATAAGLRSGDVILRYAGNRVFNPDALYTWSTEGEYGAPTEIEVSRNGETIHLLIPRGPLGARLSHDRMVPGR